MLRFCVGEILAWPSSGERRLELLKVTDQNPTSSAGPQKTFFGARFRSDRSYLLMSQDSLTHASLLLKLRDEENHVAWEQFVAKYGPMIFQWCRYWKLQQADAEDLTQGLLLKLFHTLTQFDYDPSKGSFRGWLKTITRNAFHDYCRTRKHGPSGDSKIWLQIQNLPSKDDLADEIDRAYEQELVQQAKQIVRRRVASHTWKAFELSELGDVPVAEISRRTGLQIAMVYVAKSKVIRMLNEEVNKLDKFE